MGESRGIDKDKFLSMVVDYGPANLRVPIVDIKGNIVAQDSYSNAPIR